MKTTLIYAHYAPSAREIEMVNAAFAPEPELAGPSIIDAPRTGAVD
jgi:hypothetical protein